MRQAERFHHVHHSEPWLRPGQCRPQHMRQEDVSSKAPLHESLGTARAARPSRCGKPSAVFPWGAALRKAPPPRDELPHQRVSPCRAPAAGWPAPPAAAADAPRSAGGQAAARGSGSAAAASAASRAAVLLVPATPAPSGPAPAVWPAPRRRFPRPSRAPPHPRPRQRTRAARNAQACAQKASPPPTRALVGTPQGFAPCHSTMCRHHCPRRSRPPPTRAPEGTPQGSAPPHCTKRQLQMATKSQLSHRHHCPRRKSLPSL
mmetsp:Transcript_102451/g.260168  ORF Transcript_102451/g.260168 Transcript_102451/m.260168 type:complete len:261 (-) Transcript_102451:572-1354(-)